ncbi:hypothetical protein [Streptomyces sp. WAC05950]|uniref:hypothetical protein n=1 Tax=Streptomyces sp. WAC05950 TaxID=2487419 RepID=UPI000F745C16|nr:hypothetical protein [Streptomyces sp. WAC05950]RST00317.1 hypothetical protein EF904_24300 [Streptomyces sp. WAC05950]
MNGRPPLEQIAALSGLLSRLTLVLVVVASVALVFTASNVTMFAIDHHVSVWIAWLLDPMVAVALGTVLIFDGRLSEYGLYPSGWATVLRWFAGLGTWVMNCWTSLWPAGSSFGIPREVDPAGLVLHSVPPVLLIVLAEAISHYRHQILTKITELQALVDAEVDEVETTPAPTASTPPADPVPVAAPREPVAAPGRAIPLVICGDRQVFHPLLPLASTPVHRKEMEPSRLSAEEAANVIRACWVQGTSLPEAARLSTRSTSYVHKIYQRLNESRQARDVLTVTVS